MVNVGNFRLARPTQSRGWISAVAASVCIGSLVVMIVQILGRPEHTRSIWTLSASMGLPFVYEIVYSRIAISFIQFKKAV